MQNADHVIEPAARRCTYVSRPGWAEESQSSRGVEFSGMERR